MSLFRFFTGKSAAEHERQGDRFAAARAWGKAKLAFEKALDRLESGPAQAHAALDRLNAKLQQSREALAAGHLQAGRGLLANGYPEDAAELFSLALELTADDVLKQQIIAVLAQCGPAPVSMAPRPTAGAEAEAGPAPEDIESHFESLCAMLPEDIQEIYAGYGEDFKAGYVALNQGLFELAAEHLDRAGRHRPDAGDYILLERAGAYFNLGRTGEARELLETFIQHHPDALPGYQLLSEVCWEQGDTSGARRLLADCPTDLKGSVAFVLLNGEALRQDAGGKAAERWYADHLDKHGWHDQIAAAFADVLAGSGEPDRARALYARIIENCRGCGAQVPAEVQLKYADLCLAAGRFTDEVLEIYLALAQKDPANAAAHYAKVSRIYARRGLSGEALRFEAISRSLSDDG